MSNQNEFQRLMEEAEKTHVYRLEGAVLEFTEEMAARMEKEGISRSELARRIESSPAYITKILRGTTNFTLDSMVKIAHALGCTYRSHLEPDGCETRWMDIMRKSPSMTYRDRPALEKAIKLRECPGAYMEFDARHLQENMNDSFALVS